MPEITKEQQIVLNTSRQVLQGKRKPDFSGSFCKNFTERCIETPWAAEHLRGARTLLDVGFTFASNEYMGFLLELKDKYHVELQGADIIKPEKVRTRYPAEWLQSILEVPVMIGDIRSQKLPKEHFDAITVISTIEHIGFDEPSRTLANSAFERKLKPEEVVLNREPGTNKAVLDNLHTTLKKGGKLLISVPMGKGGAILMRDSLGLYVAEWEYDQKSLREITGHKGFELIEQRFFKNTEKGWTEVSSPEDLTGQSSYMKSHAEGCAICALTKR